jgi:hypothetical protein
MPCSIALFAAGVRCGLDEDRARLWVIDGGKALRRAFVECFGALARCSAARSTSGAT